MSRKLHNASQEQQFVHDSNETFVNAVVDKLVMECERREHNEVSGELTLRIVWRKGRAESARLLPEEIITPAP